MERLFTWIALVSFGLLTWILFGWAGWKLWTETLGPLVAALGG